MKMYSMLFCFVMLVAPLSAGVVKETSDCGFFETQCNDGRCISAIAICDGVRDCALGEDEFNCTGESIALSSDNHLHRTRRQATGCRKDQWTCRDGSCISFDGKCDGIIDCLDNSDEAHALCRGTQCQPNWFRCTYGACVDGTAPCNGVQECADNSDELLPRCRNETNEVRGQFKCLDGSSIPAANHCDGVKDCADGSDEIVRTCAAKTCPKYLFQCAYGACVDSGSDCNNIQECADNSDEADDLCNRILSPTTKPPKGGNCILPEYPDHGTYVTNVANVKPGSAVDFVTLNVTCRQGYGVIGANSIYCYNGFWSGEMPKCALQCRLVPHVSVEYRCVVSGTVEGSRKCNEYEHKGTVVFPNCNYPNYYTATALPPMRCIDGNWDYVARCSPECGTVTPTGAELVLGGESAKRGEVPWHAGIYTKTTKPYQQICGGSIISNNIVISAAHCFWNNIEGRSDPESKYAVAVGKLFRPWGNNVEEAQRSDVKQIHLPVRFQGPAANFQDDIAIVIVTDPFVYKVYIRPVCVDFDINFDRRQLKPENMGKVAGWGLTAENGAASQVLKVIDLPYIDIQTCISESPPGFREYITSDKICAGVRDAGKALCKGDSGGGLAFPESDKGTQRYYLRGVVSTAPNNDNLCNANTYTSFTQILKHEHFIKQSWEN